MDSLYVNRYKRDEGLFKELYRYFYLTRPIHILIYVISAIVYAEAITCVILYGRIGKVAAFLLIAMTVSLLVRVFNYFSQTKMAIKRDREIVGSSDKKVDFNVTVTDEFIKCGADGIGFNTIAYDSVRVVKQTKNLILICTKARLVYTLRKDSFEVGTKDEFLAFMRSKGITVKGK